MLAQQKAVNGGKTKPKKSAVGKGKTGGDDEEEYTYTFEDDYFPTYKEDYLDQFHVKLPVVNFEKVIKDSEGEPLSEVE